MPEVDTGSGGRTLLLGAVLLVFTLGVLALRAAAPAKLERAVQLAASKRCWLPLSVLLLAAFGVMVLYNTAYPGYLDHAEPNIVCVSWLVRQGAPLYRAFDSAARYTLLYGPGTYLPYASAFYLLGGATLSAKCVVLVCNCVLVYFLWRTYRAVLGGSAGLLLVAVVLLFMFVPRPNHYLFQARADILIISATAVALFGATSRAGLAGPIALSIATAFVLDAKATAVIYIAPLFAILLRQRGWRVTVLVALGSGSVAVLPFLLPNVSLTQYVRWLRSATGHPSTLADLRSTLRTLPMLLAPLVLSIGVKPWRDPKLVAWLRENWLLVVTLLVCLVLGIVASTRIGAGSHHLLPFVPLLGYVYVQLYSTSSQAFKVRLPWMFRYVAAFLVIAAIMRAGGGLAELRGGIASREVAMAVRDEVRSVLTRYPHRSIAMGYGERQESLTYFRPELVFATSTYLVDEMALSDMNLDGMPIPTSTVAALESCKVAIWLIPKAQRPFLVPSSFSESYAHLVPPVPLFSAKFREAFDRHYQRRDSTAHFDIYWCDKSES